jgi:lipopolysaccharide/colanic/teichoic acid biosynthesis glycosyltransferase/glycosyltransferase involved in cell wall biosynthesis
VKPRLCIVVSSPSTVKAFLCGHIRHLSGSYDITVAANCAPAELESIVPGGVRCLSVPIARRTLGLSDLKSVLILERFFRCERIDIVHSYTPKAGLIAMVAAWLARVPLRFHTFTGQVWYVRRGFTRVVLKGSDVLIAKLATDVLADSASQLSFLRRERVLRSDQGRVLGSGSVGGIDLARFRPDPIARVAIRENLGVRPDDFMVLFAGRINRDKGLLDLAHAFGKAAQQCDQLRLVVIGADEEGLAEDIKSAASLASPRVTILPATDVVEQYMAAADVFCLPSHREGFGSVLIEAAACGVPAIASRIYGITDAIEDSVTGKLVPAGGAAALSEALVWACEHRTTVECLGIAALDRARTQFDAAILEVELERFYREELDGLALSRRTTSCRQRHKIVEGAGLGSRGLLPDSVAGRTKDHRGLSWKRVADFLVALIGLLVLLPLLAVVALLIVVWMGRPVFFLQERVGLHGRTFRIIKFRTMTRDAEQRTQGQWIATGNPYVTPVGRFLRKTSLDELPELVNVLKGDMSLVGPRPTLPEQVAAYDIFQHRRLEVRPGITGWAQVNGRNSISWTERIKLDVWYIDYWTPWLDVRILLMTIGQVLRQRGVEDVPPTDGIVGGGKSGM